MPWRSEPEIDPERARFLTERRAITPSIAEGVYPFTDVALSRADVEWLLATHESGGALGPVEWPDQRQRDRAGLDLRGADLRGADLRGLPLARLHAGVTAQEQFVGSTVQAERAAARFDEADLSGAHLEDAALFGARLERVTATEAHFEQALLAHAVLDGAFLGQAHLEGAVLIQGRLQHVFLRQAHLERADLREAYLEGADLGRAQLAGSNLQRAFFDPATQLDGVSLWTAESGAARLAGVRWGGVDLAGVTWSHVRQLGEEQQAQRVRTTDGRAKSRAARLRECEEAVRANRQLAVALQGQGLTEVAARFGYRAQVLQRRVLRLQGIGALGAYLFSLLLAVLAGYGYRLWRIAIAYILTVMFFAVGYLVARYLASPGQAPTGEEALNAMQISLNAIHGRVFFAQFGLDTLQSWLATIESIVGIVIEGVFVAMLIRRFFDR
jgi:uncharacterized protein YjbI with pentapeptide repeats